MMHCSSLYSLSMSMASMQTFGDCFSVPELVFLCFLICSAPARRTRLVLILMEDSVAFSTLRMGDRHTGQLDPDNSIFLTLPMMKTKLKTF